LERILAALKVRRKPERQMGVSVASNEKRREQREANQAAVQKISNAVVEQIERTATPQSSQSELAALPRENSSSVTADSSKIRLRCRVLARRICGILLWLWLDKGQIFTWIFRLAALASISYLVSDRFYETGIVISVSSSDPKQPFYFPFSLTNNSHIFAMHNIKHNCFVDDLELPGGGGLKNIGISFQGESSKLEPGDIVNVSCRRALNVANGVVPTKVVIHIVVDYDMSVLWFFTLHRDIAMKFTWGGDASNPQWIRGELVE